MEMHNTTPPPDELRDMIYYENGELYWLPEHRGKAGGRRSDKPIGNLDKDGYKVCRLRINGVYRDYKIHRLVYWFVKGEWVPMIDHKDRNRLNNLIDNLHPTDPKGNAKNQGKPKNNSNGYVGVRKQPSGNYSFTVSHDSKTYSICGYKTPEAAALARDMVVCLMYGENVYLNLLDKNIKIVT